MKDFMQCCYTRMGGQAVGAGWQTVACSEDVPLEVQKNYGTLQNAHVPTVTPVDEAGEPLNLFDISVIGDQLYLTRIQYGLLDELNRKNNMFAHTFLFSMKDDQIIKNPNVFLTVRNDNFKSTAEEAGEIPDQLQRRQDFTMEEALELCGLDQKGYETLIQCVYAQFYANKGKKPLYLCGMENDEQLRALLYCIYKGIPYAMRRVLSSATANINDSLKKNLIFSNKKGSSDLFLDVKTGSNNILTPRVISRFARYEYVDAYPRHWKSPSWERYFDILETMAVKLGNPAAMDPTVLKIAHQMIINQYKLDEMIERYDENDLHEKIYEALTARSENSPLMDEYLAKMISKVNKESYLLREEEEDALAEKLGSTQSKALQQAAEQYNINSLSQMEPIRAAAKLNMLRKEIFCIYSRKLVEMPAGNEILDLYYSKYYLSEQTSWQELQNLIEEISYLDRKPNTIDRIEATAWNLYTKALDESEQIREEFEEYLSIMSKVSGGALEYGNCVHAAKEEYWEHISIDNFDIQKQEEYYYFRIDDSDKCRFILELLQLLNAIPSRDFTEPLLIETAAFAGRYRIVLDEAGKNRLLELIAQESERTGKEFTQNKKEWYKIAVYLMDSMLMRETLELASKLNQVSQDFSLGYEGLQKQLLSPNRNLKPLSTMINHKMIKLAKGWEKNKETNMVMLDNWLLLGKYEYINPFQILDEVDMNILNTEADFICEESILLSEKEYQEYAEEYIHEGGGKAKQVKEWMSIMRKLQKKQKNAQKQPSAVSGIFNKIAQKVGSGETEENTDKKKKKGGFWDRR